MATFVVGAGTQPRADDDLVYISNTIKPMPTKHRHVPSERKGFGSQTQRFRGNIPGVPSNKGSGPEYHSALGDMDVGLDGYQGSGIWGVHDSALKAKRSLLGTSSFAPPASSPQNLRMVDVFESEMPIEPSQYNEYRLKELSDLRQRQLPDASSPGPGTYTAPTQFRGRAPSRVGGRGGRFEGLRAEASAPSRLGGLGGRSPAVSGRDTPGPGQYSPDEGERRRFARESVKSTVLSGNTGHSRSRPRRDLKAPSISTTLHWGRDWRTLMPFGVERPPRPHSVAGAPGPGAGATAGRLPPRPATTAPPGQAKHPRGHGGISAYLSPYSATPSSAHRLRKANYELRSENSAPLVSFRTGSLRPSPTVDRALSTAGTPGGATWSASRAGSALPPSPGAEGLRPESSLGDPATPARPLPGTPAAGGTPAGGVGLAKLWGPESYETPPGAGAGAAGAGGGGEAPFGGEGGITEAAWHAQKARDVMRGRYEWNLRSKMVAVSSGG